MRKMTPVLFAAALLLLVSLACEAATPTPTTGEVMMTMLGDQVNAQATQAKFESIAQVTAQVAAATATQQASFAQATQFEQSRIDAQATAMKADANALATASKEEANAQATDYQRRMDAQATQQRMDFEATQSQSRIDANATADQARLDLVATQQAAGTATAGVITLTAIPPMQTMTSIADQQNIQLKENEVQKSNVEVKQAWDTNVIMWLVPMLLAIAGGVVGAIYFHNRSKIREVKNADGDVDAVIFENEKLISLKLLPKPVLYLESGEMPDLVNPKEQSEIVRREQGIRALEVMPERPMDGAMETYQDMFTGPRRSELPTIEVVSPEGIGPGILEEVEGQVAED